MGNKIIKLCLLMSLAVLVSTGCTKKQIFVQENEEYLLKSVPEAEIKPKTYYIKNNSEFYATASFEGTAHGTTQKSKADRFLYAMKDITLIPTLYEDEIIAYKDDIADFSDICFERFYDNGYSLGVTNVAINNDMHATFSLNNCIKDSDLYNKLSNLESTNFRLVSINGNPITNDSINSTGIFQGMEQNAAYELELYAGTVYLKTTVTADVRYFISFETYVGNNIGDTKNGYLSIKMPKECLDGYYMINGKGFFKYYDTEKQFTDEENTDFNIPYYSSDLDEISSRSQQYIVNVPSASEMVSFNVEFDGSGLTENDVAGILKSPEGTIYDMNIGTNEMYVNLDNVMPGDWIINIVPSSLAILNISAKNIIEQDTATLEEFYLDVEAETNKMIYIRYDGDGDIWGTISFDGENAREFDIDTQEKYLYTTYEYIPGGTYTIHIYHYADTVVYEPQITDYDNGLSEDVIIIESE